MPRVYDGAAYQKHKRPKGWGSLCPEGMGSEAAQELLDSGVECEGAIYNIDGELAFRAFEHRPDHYHGHPLPWTRLPSEAVDALIADGRLDEATYRKAIRKGWGSE